ncbi:hypothetical protein RFI_00493 [Reticulomyxa filosa]|uniref:Uncharacterized protein n=1 Tax=Reticulomyxa filosa TaxID=46433 RepID=X6PEU8_RETFI|nr:hypothetical protein RFI_00493 [Reticulomyxa filosa]|eukprot:ETO36569.1 hypothetical protein RFI_00493 [Reticulomyxa filosa]
MEDKSKYFIFKMTKVFKYGDFDEILLETKQQTLFMSFHVAKTVVIQQKIVFAYKIVFASPICPNSFEKNIHDVLLFQYPISEWFLSFEPEQIVYPCRQSHHCCHWFAIIDANLLFYIYYLFVVSNRLQFRTITDIVNSIFFQIFFDLANQTKIIIQLLMK